MKTFLDTSVLIAAFWGDHPCHKPSLRLFVEANRETGACGVHSLAEIYAVLTSLPVRPPLGPEQGFLFVEQVAQRLAVITLDDGEYLNAIRDLSDRGWGGGRINDALLLACARKSQAQRIYTWNQKHFSQIAPDLADRIHTP